MLSLFLIAATMAATASAHFLLNLNVRIFHVEHTSNGLLVHMRMPMPYLVADKIGETGVDGLPAAAPFTTNAMEDGQLVHYLDLSQVAVDPLRLGEIASQSTIIETGNGRLVGDVQAVVLHRVGDEPGFATLEEARDALARPSTLGAETPVFVGDVVVDILVEYRTEQKPSRYLISSQLDPGLPDQDTTANLVLDYAAGEPLVFRSRGLMADPIEVSRAPFSAFATFVWEGIRHILEGIDHVLFVACLVIGAPALRDLLWRVTGFTVGHSVTLSLGFFGFVPSGAWFIPTVETGIALSIIYAALIALRGTKVSREANRRVFVVTVAIGLLHGLGFSFVLQEILQVTSPNIWQSLLAFNIGVEIGQVAIVLLIWPLLHFIGRISPYGQRYAKATMAITCCAIAAWWTFERTKEVLSVLTA
ncbi:MAG: HupE/UreJ family protein [Pseudomonadota bacterium]